MKRATKDWLWFCSVGLNTRRSSRICVNAVWVKSSSFFLSSNTPLLFLQAVLLCLKCKKWWQGRVYLVMFYQVNCLKQRCFGRYYCSCAALCSHSFLCVCNCSLFSLLRTMWVRRPSTRLLVRAVWNVSMLSWFREQKLSKSCDQTCMLISFLM